METLQQHYPTIGLALVIGVALVLVGRRFMRRAEA